MEIINKTIVGIAVTLIKAYRIIISPYSGQSCRHIPSCSQYSIEAFETHGLFVGLYLTVKRIIGCRPGGNEGYDPVPEKKRVGK